MSYLNFLLIFIVPLLVVESFIVWRIQHPNKRLILFGIGILAVVAILYTTPWDNYLVKTEVWGYGADRIIGTIGYVPIEEYCFFVLQTALTGMWFFILQTRFEVAASFTTQKTAVRLVGGLLAALWLSSIVMLKFEPTTYLGLILVWSLPVILFQWFFGGHYLLKNLKVFFLTVGVPTVYLWLVDAYAINDQIWSISETQTTGFKIGVLPIEEAVFFLVTNLMVGQGLVLLIAMKDEVLRGSMRRLANEH